MMGSKKRVAVIWLMVMALVATLFAACGGDGGANGDKTVITIGLMTDITGPAGGPCQPFGWAVEDIVRYTNEEEPIPGAELRVVTYDTAYDPSRDIPGYEWLKSKGAKIIITPLPPTADTLKPFAEPDKVPVMIQSAAEGALDPPGWVFAWAPPTAEIIQPLIKYLGDNWTESRKIKIGATGWALPYGIDLTRGIREYCQAHADKFDYVGDYLAPMGTLTWSGEIAKLKDCDYISIPATGMGPPSFVKQARDSGYAGAFVSTDAVGGYVDLMVNKVGWPILDGLMTAYTTLYWNAPVASIEAAKDALDKWRAGEKSRIIATGTGYSSAWTSSTFWLDILRRAVETVGAENFDGRAFFDAAIEAHITLEGYREAGYSPSKRYALNDIVLYRWTAADEDLIQVGGWLPLVD